MHRALIALLIVAPVTLGCGSAEHTAPPAPEPATTNRGLVFRSSIDHSQGEIYYVNRDGTGLARLTTDSVYDNDPSVSPDGTRIAYSCRVDLNPPDKNIDICIMNIDGSNQLRLTTDTAVDFFPRWSPDGQTIIFSSDRDNNGLGRDLWLMAPDGSNQRRLTTIAPAVYEAARFNAAGTRLVVTYRDLPGTVDLYFLNSDGSAPAPFVTTSADEMRAVWSPDDRQLAYTVIRSITPYLIIRDTTGAHPITIDSPGTYSDVTWSTDGVEVAAACTGFPPAGLCRITPSGKRIVPIPNTALATSPDWVP